MKLLADTGDDALPGSGTAHTWKALRYFNYYRTLLAGLLTGLYYSGVAPSTLGSHSPILFESVGLLYFGFGAAAIFTIRKRTPEFATQVNAQVLVDVVALTLLMHASGGLASGLALLMVVAIAGGSIMTVGRMAGMYAAFAAIAVLGEQVYAQVTNSFGTTSYTHAGFLGIAFFATTLLSFVLARRVRESEALAAQRSVDLANMEQLNDYIIRNMESGIVVVDPGLRVRMINESGWQLLGMPVIRDGQPLADIAPELAAQIATWLKNPDGGPEPFQPTADGPAVLPRFTPVGSGEAAGVLVFLEDSTQVTQQLQQMKLASLGRLTASIAHEIRNPLAAVSHAAQLLDESPALDQNEHRMTEIIRNHSRRMNSIVENVLQLSRREQSHPRMLTLKPWLEEFADDFSLGAKLDRAALTVDVDPEEMQVRFDPNHLQQIVWNLCHNAVDHAAPDTSPAIILRAGTVAESRGPFLEIIDNGPGIEREVAEQIFDPFFTTAASGTGLGLYIARELCECNRARLNHIPHPTEGSCFRISFYDAASTGQV